MLTLLSNWLMSLLRHACYNGMMGCYAENRGENFSMYTPGEQLRWNKLDNKKNECQPSDRERKKERGVAKQALHSCTLQTVR